MGKLQQLSIILGVLPNFYPKTTKTLMMIGFLVILRKMINAMRSLYSTVLRRRVNFKGRYGRNSWALITGSSDGIGKGIALSLAKEGFNIILSARTESKLEGVKNEIKRMYPSLDVKILVVDYERSSEPSHLQRALESFKDLDISILVNNVGVDVLEHFHSLSQQQITRLIKVNCFAVSIMNRIFIQRFLNRSERRSVKSAIVNVASLAGQIPMPFHNVYSASKAFVDTLSRALSYEYSDKIDILSLNPSEVCTPMTFHKKDIFTISPEQCANGLLDQLGQGTKTTNGNWTHKLQGAIYHAVPECVFNAIWMRFIAPQFMQQRKKALLRVRA